MSREVEVSAESNRVIKNVLNPLAVFRAHKTRTLLSGFAAVLTAFLVTLYCSASYESSIAIHLNRARVATINDNAKGSETQISEEEFKKHSEILLSQTVLEAVVKELNLAANTKMAQLEAVAELRQRLKVALSKHQITVSCEDDNADRGAQILKALFEKYEVHYHSLARQAEAAQLLPEKMVALNLTTTELQEKLSQIKVDENADEKTVKRGVLLRQYYQTISQLNATRAELFEVEQRLLELQSFIVKPPTQIESGSYSQPAPIDTHKRSETLPSETEHKQTLTPQNSNQQLIDDLLDAQAKHAALNERQKTLLDSVTQIHTMLQELDQQGTEASGIENSHALVQEASNIAPTKSSAFEIFSPASGETVVSLTMEKLPTAKRHPISSPTLTTVVLCVVLGLIASCLGAYAAEYFNPRLKKQSLATSRKKVPVLANIPEL